ncbi:MAG: HEAT repeat domain-containing protein [Pirellulaceae bacterium]|nr:HEAT repeat domain-containing protein [Pirellulaceae bacterium]
MRWSLFAILLVTVIVTQPAVTRAADFALQKGDHICIVGGTMAERMQHYGWLETLLHAQYPEHELVFRNLAYSGDEIDGFRNPNTRMRSRDFGTFDQWLSGSAPCPQVDKLSPRDAGKVRENRFELTNTKADVIFAFYGATESAAGEAGLAAFKKNASDFVDHVLSKQYNGKSAPRLVLFSPTAHEYIQDPNLPTQEFVKKHNAAIRMYADALAEVAKAKNVTYVDIVSSTAGEKAVGKSLTINGVHQNEQGDLAIAQACEKGLTGKTKYSSSLDSLRKAVLDKSFYWYNRYRVTDGYSTYGDRAFLKFSEGPGGYGDGLSNYSVGQRELDILDVKTSNRDKIVWSTARGKSEKADDSNIPELIPVISNKPGPLEGGKHEFLTGTQSIEKMTVHKNMKVELFAEESMFPEFVNPVQMAFDTKGRLWVAVWPTYPHWNPTEPMADKLLILEDTNNDGKADVCKTFAGDIHNPTGFEFWGGGVLVAQGPDILFLKDTNGDDKYDIKERIVHGLDTADTHHTSNSFALDPGGAVYFQEGTFHHTQVESPWGTARRVANGAVFRYEPRTQKFDVYVSFGFANPHGHAFEKWGQDFVYDGTGAQPYHALLFSGDLDYPNKHGRPPQVYQQRTRPCAGVEILSSSHFPEEHRDNLLVLNVIGFQGVLQYKLEEKDSSFSATEVEPIVSSTDPNFRPSDIEVAPDGSIYFADWHNPIIGHMQHNLRDPSRDRNHGRMYRVRYEGRDLLKPEKIAGEPIDKLLTLLESKDDRVRHRARIELSGRPTAEVIAAAKAWTGKLNKSDAAYEHHMTEALWLHQSHNVVNEELLKQMLKSPEPRARAAATRVLVYWRDRIASPLELLQKQVNDENSKVRLQAIWALSYFSGADAAKASEIAVESLVYDQDDYIKHTLSETNKTLDRRVKAFTEVAK